MKGTLSAFVAAITLTLFAFVVTLWINVNGSSTSSLLAWHLHLGYYGKLALLTLGQAAPAFPSEDMHDVIWLNTAGSQSTSALARTGPALSMRSMQKQGKFVLLHFWDYTQLASLLNLPIVKNLQRKYGPLNLEVVGVHYSRYSFANRISNLARATERLGIRYSVANDIHGDITHSYGVTQFPSLFLVDPSNTLVARHLGPHAAQEMQRSVCMALTAHDKRYRCSPAYNWFVPIFRRWLSKRKLSSPSSALAMAPTSAARSAPPTAMARKLCALLRSADDAALCLRSFSRSPAFPSAAAAAAAAPATAAALGCAGATPDLLFGSAHAAGLAGRALQPAAGPKGTAYTDLAGVALRDGQFLLGGQWRAAADGVTVEADAGSGLIDTHLRLMYHAERVYAVLGLAALESGAPPMCADGRHGPAPAGAACVRTADAAPAGAGGAPMTECRDAAGARGGLHGWCFTGPAGPAWGGCTPCRAVGGVKVYLQMDGGPLPAAVRGKDVREDALGRTFVTVRESRLYRLISEARTAPHSLVLLPAEPGVTLHQFTFAADCLRPATAAPLPW